MPKLRLANSFLSATGVSPWVSTCRREGIAPSLYYKWSKTFLQAGKRRFKGDTLREANSDEVSELRQENEQLKQLVAELSLKNRVLKKSLNGLE